MTFKTATALILLFALLVSLSAETSGDQVCEKNSDCSAPADQFFKHDKRNSRALKAKPTKNSKILEEKEFDRILKNADGTETARRIKRFIEGGEKRNPAKKKRYFEFYPFNFRNYFFTQEHLDRILDQSNFEQLNSEEIEAFKENLKRGVETIELPIDGSLVVASYKSHRLIYNQFSVDPEGNKQPIGKPNHLRWVGTLPDSSEISLLVSFSADRSEASARSEFSYKGSRYHLLPVRHTGYYMVKKIDKKKKKERQAEEKRTRESVAKRSHSKRDYTKADMEDRARLKRERDAKFKSERVNPPDSLRALNPQRKEG